MVFSQLKLFHVNNCFSIYPIPFSLLVNNYLENIVSHSWSTLKYKKRTIISPVNSSFSYSTYLHQCEKKCYYFLFLFKISILVMKYTNWLWLNLFRRGISLVVCIPIVISWIILATSQSITQVIYRANQKKCIMWSREQVF